jgi:hypothetical protein
LARDLSTAVEVITYLDDDRDEHARARLVYTASKKGLFGDTERAPEHDVGRVLRQLAQKRRLVIDRDELDGRRVFCRLPSRVVVVVELLGARP